MYYKISELEALVEQGYLRKSEKDGLTLYGYTDKTTFDRNWNEFTRAARGLIVNSKTGFVIAKPFEKFFNLGEMEETMLKNLPDMHYQAFEKVDGSLGIIFFNKDKWDVATRGSFHSEQAQKAQTMLSQYDFSKVPKSTTILAEIIYPSNKIIVDYGDEEKLVMLGANNCFTGTEYSTSDLLDLSLSMNMEMARPYDYTIEQMIELQKTLPKDDEGFVVRFDNGLRVKIKGAEYLRIAKLISQMSPISFWEAMEQGKVDTKYLVQLPEEFKEEFEPIVATLEAQYSSVKEEIEKDFSLLPTREVTPTSRKEIGLFLASTNTIKHKPAMFPVLLGNKENVEKYIMKLIRPDGNSIKTLDK